MVIAVGGCMDGHSCRRLYWMVIAVGGCMGRRLYWMVWSYLCMDSELHVLGISLPVVGLGSGSV